MYRLLRFLLTILSCIPFRMLYILSDGLYYIIYYMVRYRRTIVRRNLTESFPEKSMAEIVEVEKKFYRFFMDMFFESCKMATISPQEMSRRMKFSNLEPVKALLKQGKSISTYIGHYGNWEWISSLPLHLEGDVVAAQIYHRLRNESMDRLMLHHRERMGAVSVEMRRTARYINELAARRQVSIIGYIADQSPRKRDSRHFLQFLHHWAPVLTGTEKITKHYGLEAWFLDVKRVKRGYYEAEFVCLHDNPQSLPDFELTALYFQHLERTIRQRPELYLWTHRRFKHATIIES